MGMKTNIVGAAIGAALTLTPSLLQRIEGVEYKPYYDIAGVLTVCSGITGEDVVLGKTYTKSECDALLYKHIAIAKKEVDKRVKRDIPPTMRASMYSFTFNAGTGAFRNSTMLRLINRGEYHAACRQLWRWVYFYNPKTGKMEKSKGLKNRRAEEFAYCIKDI